MPELNLEITGPAGERAAPLFSRVLLAVCFLILLAFAIGTRTPLLREGIWRDEALSVYIARAPSVSELIRRNRVADYNPPLFNFLLAGYGRLAGFGEASLKGFALFWGLLALGGAAFLAREIAGRAAALLAAILAVNNPLLIRMSVELRPYSLSAFLCVVSLALVLRMRSPAAGCQGPVASAILICLLISLAYSHVAGGLVVAIFGGWGALEWALAPERPFGRKLSIAAITAGASFLFWAPTTWKQFRVGIPYETSLPFAQRLRSLAERSHEAFPASEISGGAIALIGIVIVAVVGLLTARPIMAKLRDQTISLAVLAVAAAVVWLTLGVFSNGNRYLTIPAILLCVVAASLSRCALEAARVCAPGLGTLAVAGMAAFAAASFSARVGMYVELFEQINRPKSGIRTLCRDRPPRAGELLVTAPDYLASTAWYYCGETVDLHGFVRWDEAVLLDLKKYAALWRARDAPRRALLQIGEVLRETGRGGFELIWEEAPAPSPLFYERRLDALREALPKRYEESPLGRYTGKLETVRASWFEARRLPP